MRHCLSYMSQSWCCVGCGTWNWGSHSSCHLLWTGNEDIQWKLVGTGCQERKRERCAHQATVQRCSGCEQRRCLRQWREQLHAQIAAVSKALTELEASEDKDLIQPLESRLTVLKARLHGARRIGQVDGLHGVISCEKRLAEAEIAKAEAEATIIKETEDIGSTEPNSQNSNHSSLHLRGFAKQTSRTTGCPNGLQARCHQSPNTCWKAVAEA